MHKTYEIKGFANNASGRTVDLCYEIIATSARYAASHAIARAQQQGYNDIQMFSVREVRHG